MRHMDMCYFVQRCHKGYLRGLLPLETWKENGMKTLVVNYSEYAMSVQCGTPLRSSCHNFNGMKRTNGQAPREAAHEWIPPKQVQSQA